MIEIKDTKQSPDRKHIVDEKESKEAKESIRSMVESERRSQHTEVKEDRRKNKQLKSDKINLLRYPFIGGALLILAAVMFYLALMNKSSVELQYQQQLESHANKELKGLMSQASKGIKKKTKVFISTLNNIKVIPFASPEKLVSLKKELQALLHDSLSLQIIPANYIDDEIIDNPEMGYTFLFLLNELKGIKNTASANFTMIELYKGNDKGKKLLLVHKVMSGDDTLAYVIARLSIDFMNNLVTKFDAENSYFEIIQPHGSTAFVLVKKGNTSLNKLPMVIAKKLKNTPWKFNYWNSEQKTSQPIEQFSSALMYLIFAILAVFSALLAFFMAFKKYRVLHPVVIMSKQKKKQEESFLTKLDHHYKKEEEPAEVSPEDIKIANKIFGLYDIRGLVGDEINTEIFRRIARVVVKEMRNKKQDKIAIACDGRNSSPQLINAVIEAVLAERIDVVDIGMVINSSVLYFAAMNKANGNGLMVTASHNTENYNGMKIMVAGHNYSGDDLQSLKQQFLLEPSKKNKDDESDGVSGNKTEFDIIEEYLISIVQNIKLSRPLKIVIATTNRVTGKFVEILFKQLSCDVTILNNKNDNDSVGMDPSRPENMLELSRKVVENKADIGFMLDGDRIGVVASDGQIILADRVLMLLAKEILSRKSGASILYDVKSSKNIDSFVRNMGGKAIMCQSGHSFIKNKLEETGALLAGEMSGHIYIKDRWFGFDDASYVAARILEILSVDLRKSGHIFSEIPNNINTPEILIATKDAVSIMKKVGEDLSFFKEGKILNVDGIRVEYSDGWGIVRASNTTDNLSLRFEADNEAALQRIVNVFKQSLAAAAPALELPF